MQLGIAGFKVRVFDSAKSLLAANFSSKNTCLLLDIYMPGMNGLELCEILASDGRQIPTILMSGRDDEETNQRARKTTGISCLRKPFTESTLLRAIRRVLWAASKCDSPAAGPLGRSRVRRTDQG